MSELQYRLNKLIRRNKIGENIEQINAKRRQIAEELETLD